MGYGVSIFLFAIGAILAFAVHASSNVLNVNTVGWILMAVGLLGGLLTLAFWSDYGFRGRRRRVTTYEDDGPSYY